MTFNFTGHHMSFKSRFAIFLLIAVGLSGCGPRPVTGGTKGVLRLGGKPRSDIQITLHQMDSGSPQLVGFGLTANDGSFRLLKEKAKGSLWLPAGEYLCTLESAGSPIRIAREYGRPETTPLKISWSGSEKSLDLDVPLIPAHERSTAQ
jgi:hypothetical protein